MSKNLDLRQRARQFSDGITRVLNKTVTTGIRLSVILNVPDNAVVGYKSTKINPTGNPIPLTISKAPPRLHLSLVHSLVLDDTGKAMTTSRSEYALCQAEADEVMLSYDFVAKPQNVYPGTHLHLHGDSAALQNMLNTCERPRDRPVDLHVPVGGRLFRPCVEDIIEFCVLEQLVDAHDGWEDALNESRDRYRQSQLRVAVRQSPQYAADYLRQEGWQVKPPSA